MPDGKEKKKLASLIKKFIEFNTPEDAQIIRAVREGKSKIVERIVSLDDSYGVTVKLAEDIYGE